MSLLGRDRFEDVATAALSDGVDEALVLAFHSFGGLTRFAGSQIHQNTWRENVQVAIMAVVDGNRVGVAAGSSLDPEAVRGTLRSATAIARVTPANT
ncbi:MAG: hypothetical protein ACXVQ7_08025, partial [Actinomycetota bacterium]